MSPDTTRPAYVIGFTALVAAAFTAAVMGVQVAARGRIRRNEAFFRQRALVSAFRLGDVSQMSRERIAQVYADRIEGPEAITDPETGERIETYRAFSTSARAAGRTEIGVAFLFRGRGFWDEISGFLALTPDLKRVIGLAILSQKETPGLGGRIAEADFASRFRDLDVSPPRAKGGRFIYVTTAEPAGEQDPRFSRTVDAITGATQTSMALDRLLNANLAAFRRAMAARASAAPPKGG